MRTETVYNNPIDYAALRLVDRAALEHPWLDQLAWLASDPVVKTLPVVVVVWSVWFARPDMRDRIVALLAATLPIIAIARLLAVVLPYRLRPLADPDSGSRRISDAADVSVSDWSAMPSDHAVLWFAVATGLFFVSRMVGLYATLYAALVISLTRLYLGLHWLTDLIVGALVGAGLMMLLLRPLEKGVRAIGLVPYFERRPAWGYPILFVATFLLANMFEGVRRILGTLYRTIA